jgi:hypothetical protein
VHSLPPAETIERSGSCTDDRQTDPEQMRRTIYPDFEGRQHRVLIGWSEHEVRIVQTYCPDLAAPFVSVYRDAKRDARVWRSTLNQEINVPKIGTQPRHRLSVYAAAVGHENPGLGEKAIGATLRELRARLSSRPFDRQSAGLRARWAEVLAHNENDLRATRAVAVRVAEELAQAEADQHRAQRRVKSSGP